MHVLSRVKNILSHTVNSFHYIEQYELHLVQGSVQSCMKGLCRTERHSHRPVIPAWTVDLEVGPSLLENVCAGLSRLQTVLDGIEYASTDMTDNNQAIHISFYDDESKVYLKEKRS